MQHQAPAQGGPPPGSPQQFCLRWNNYQTNLTNVFDQLLQSESFVDVTLACEGHSVKAHKMVLSACSPYFQSLFFDNPCQHPIVILKDIKWPELKAVVEFMYRGEINVSQEQIGPLLKVAESLKIRGLADVNGESDLAKEDLSLSRKKRRRTSAESSPEGSPAESLDGRAPLELVTTSPSLQQQQQQQPQQPQQPQQQPALVPLPLPPPPPAQQPSQPASALPPPPVPPPQQQPDDMEIKPGIAEMIREEERGEFGAFRPVPVMQYRTARHDGRSNRVRNFSNTPGDDTQFKAKMLESSHAWLGASTSSLADSYQYQLQSMWQKCWNTNQSLVHNLRFRERGPLKSWRPETMAEAILSVLKEGLSLSQAARKYDIPYPTFVLYANRVHNMLGPSADGGTDLRPKGRGRPQRILLGIWPEEHIRGVIRAVVFRDPQHIKEDTINLGYPRIPTWLMMKTVSKPVPPTRMLQNYEDITQNQHEHLAGYAAGAGVLGGGGVPVAGGGAGPLVDPCGPVGAGGSGPGAAPGGGVSPNSAAAAAVVAVAQGLRQQMLAAAAAAHHQVHHGHNHNHHHQQQQQQGPAQQQGPPQQLQHQHQQQHHDFGGFLAAQCAAAAAAAATGNGTAGHMLHSPLPSPVDSSPRSSPLAPNNNLEVGGVGLSGYKPMLNDSLMPTRSGEHHLFHDEIEDLVKRPQPNDTPKIKPVMGFKPLGNDLSTTRADHLFHDDMEPMMKRPHAPETPKVKVGLGMSSLGYKPGGGAEGYGVIGGQRDTLFQEEIDEFVKSPQQQQQQQQLQHQIQQQQQQIQQQQQPVKEPPQSPAPQQAPPPQLHLATVDQRAE